MGGLALEKKLLNWLKPKQILWKTYVQEVLFSKFAVFWPVTLLKNQILHNYFSMQLDPNPQPLSSQTNTQPFGQTGH